MQTFHTKDLVNKYAESNGISKAEAKKQVDSVLKELSSLVCEGNVVLTGLFSLTHSVRKGRNGVMHGKEWKTEDKNILKFRVGNELDFELNK